MKRFLSPIAVLLGAMLMVTPVSAAPTTSETTPTTTTEATQATEATEATEPATEAATQPAVTTQAAEVTPAVAVDNEAFQAYLRTVENMEDITSMEAIANMKVTADVEGETLDMNMKMDIAYVYTITGGLQMAMTMKLDSMDIAGEEYGAMDLGTIYYRDGYMYQTVGDRKVRYRATIDEALDNTYQMDDDISIEMIKKGEVEDLDSGGKRIKLTISGADMTYMVDEILSTMYQSMGLGDTNVVFGDILYHMDLDKNNRLRNYRMAFNMAMNASDLSMKAKYDMNVRILTLNTLKKIEFPVDINSHELIENPAALAS